MGAKFNQKKFRFSGFNWKVKKGNFKWKLFGTQFNPDYVVIFNAYFELAKIGYK